MSERIHQKGLRFAQPMQELRYVSIYCDRMAPNDHGFDNLLIEGGAMRTR
jgi:hypothetical protein